MIINNEYEENELAVKEAIRISRETIEAITNKHFTQSSPQDSPIFYIRVHNSPYFAQTIHVFGPNIFLNSTVRFCEWHGG